MPPTLDQGYRRCRKINAGERLKPYRLSVERTTSPYGPRYGWGSRVLFLSGPNYRQNISLDFGGFRLTREEIYHKLADLNMAYNEGFYMALSMSLYPESR